jgi:cell fate (sporulation/competence/biofilm development) regulator YlbF (YheA/YmcA/DUF963 family)
MIRIVTSIYFLHKERLTEMLGSLFETNVKQKVSIVVLISLLFSLLSGFSATVHAAQLELTAATLNYVKYSDKNVSYDSTVGSNYYDAKTYELNGQKYLRVSVLESTINLKLVIDGVTPTEVSSIYNAEDVVIAKVFDYAIDSFTAPIVGRITYSAGGFQGNHPTYIMINQDATAQTRAALKAKLVEANALENKSVALTQAIAAASEVDHLLSREAELQAQLTALTTAITKETVELTAATLNYVKYSDKNVSYDGTVGNNYYDAKTYEFNGQKYLRVSVVQSSINLKLEMDGVTPTEVSSIYNAENVVIAKVFDYAIESFTAPLVGRITYSAGGHQGNHPTYIMINQDATAQTRAALKAKLVEANALENKSVALTQAIAAASEVDHLLSREAELQAQLTALTAAIAKESVELTAATLNYVKYSDKNVSYDGIVGNNYYDAKTYEFNGQKYLRVSVVQSSINLKLEMDGVTPTEVSSIYNAENVVIAKVFDYAIESFTAPLVGRITYSAGGHQGNHPTYIMINQDATAQTRAALKAKLVEANALENKSVVLTQAIAAASEVDHLLSREAELQAQLTALTTAVTDETNPGTDPGTAPETNPGPGSSTGNTGGNSTTNPGEDSSNNEENPGEVKPTTTFNDVKSHWAASVIERAVSLGIANGYADGTFKPNASINRAEFTTLIARAFKLDKATETVTFADDNSIPAWAQPLIQQVVAAGIISGYEDNTFRAASNISRSEMVVMVVRALGLELESADSLTFNDSQNIPQFAKAYVATALKHGLIKGKTENEFGANLEASRAEALTLILRAIDYAAPVEK